MHRPLAISLAILGGSAAVAAECTADAFAAILENHPEATVSFVEAVPQNGSFGQAAGVDLPFPNNATNLPALCAVGVNVKSSESSSYNFGLFLPDTTWNERFMTTGNGGFGGGINWPDMGIFSQVTWFMSTCDIPALTGLISMDSLRCQQTRDIHRTRLMAHGG